MDSKPRFVMVLGVMLWVCGLAHAQTIWPGYTKSFVKTGFADFTQPQNQDRMTPNVWITRGDNRGVFNIAREAAYQGAGQDGPSPVGTRWAFGTTANLTGLTFTTWAVSHADNPPGLVGRDMVVHLVEDDIYVDIRFTHWGVGGGAGGSVAYVRGEAPPPVACCRGATCNSVPAGQCTGQVAGGQSLIVTSCGSGDTLQTCCYADFNHDGNPTIDDLFLYLNAYFTGSPWANVGGDGIAAPVIDDLFLFINGYFNGCA